MKEEAASAWINSPLRLRNGDSEFIDQSVSWARTRKLYPQQRSLDLESLLIAAGKRGIGAILMMRYLTRPHVHQSLRLTQEPFSYIEHRLTDPGYRERFTQTQLMKLGPK